MKQDQWIVEFKSLTGDDWTQVGNIKYTRKANALARLGKEIQRDPEYTHRLVKVTYEVECVVEGSYDPNEEE